MVLTKKNSLRQIILLPKALNLQTYNSSKVLFGKFLIEPAYSLQVYFALLLIKSISY